MNDKKYLLIIKWDDISKGLSFAPEPGLHAKKIKISVWNYMWHIMYIN